MVGYGYNEMAGQNELFVLFYYNFRVIIIPTVTSILNQSFHTHQRPIMTTWQHDNILFHKTDKSLVVHSRAGWVNLFSIFFTTYTCVQPLCVLYYTTIDVQKHKQN